MVTNLTDHSADPILDGAYTDLPADVTAAATRWVVAHGGADVLDMLGLGGAA
jgi:hypothetical protein